MSQVLYQFLSKIEYSSLLPKREAVLPDQLTSLFLSKVEISGEPSFVDNIKEDLVIIGGTKTGTELFHRLLEGKKTVKIVEYNPPESSVGFLPQSSFMNGNNLRVNISAQEEDGMYLSLDQNRKKIAVTSPRWTTLAHELIHLAHFMWGTFQSTKALPERLVDPFLTSEEEQYTIAGIVYADSPTENQPYLNIKTDEKTRTFVLQDACCENSFLQEIHLPPRLNHAGATKPTLFESLRLGAVWWGQTLTNEELNTPCYHDHTEKQLLPLTVAAYHGGEDAVEWLLQEGAGLNGEDALGGALMAALIKGHPDLAQKLIDRGISLGLKNSEGNTVSTFFDSHPMRKFDQRYKPFLHLFLSAFSSN